MQFFSIKILSLSIIYKIVIHIYQLRVLNNLHIYLGEDLPENSTGLTGLYLEGASWDSAVSPLGKASIKKKIY